MRPSTPLPRIVLCSHALLPPQRESLHDDAQLAASRPTTSCAPLAGVPVSAKLGTREPAPRSRPPRRWPLSKCCPASPLYTPGAGPSSYPPSIRAHADGARNQKEQRRRGDAARRRGLRGRRCEFRRRRFCSREVAASYAWRRLRTSVRRRSPPLTSAARRTSSWWPRPSGSKTMASSRRSRRRTSWSWRHTSCCCSFSHPRRADGAPRPETATVSKTEDAGSPVVPALLGALARPRRRPVWKSLLR